MVRRRTVWRPPPEPPYRRRILERVMNTHGVLEELLRETESIVTEVRERFGGNELKIGLPIFILLTESVWFT